MTETNFPLFQPEATLAEGGDAVVVSDDDEAVATPGVELEQQVDDLVAGGVVEVAGGFVSEEKRGVVAQGAGDGDPLLLAAGGSSAGRWVQTRAEADLG